MIVLRLSFGLPLDFLVYICNYLLCSPHSSLRFNNELRWEVFVVAPRWHWPLILAIRNSLFRPPNNSPPNMAALLTTVFPAFCSVTQVIWGQWLRQLQHP